MTAPTHPPAWHPDPSGSPNLRWWDGRIWTHHVAPMPAPQAPPEPEGVLARFIDAFDGEDEHHYASLAHQHWGLLAPVGPPNPRRGFRVPPLLGVIPGVFAAGAATASLFDGGPQVPAIIGIVAIGCMVKGWRAMWTRWHILDTPTLDNAGARPGMCELVGYVEPGPGQTVGVAPFSGQSVLAWRRSIERWEKKGKSHQWVERWSEGHTTPLDRPGFTVRSAGGSILVRLSRPERAMRDTADTHEVRSGGFIGGSRYRLKEQGLVPGDQLFCLGEVTMTFDGTLVVDDPRVIYQGDETTAIANESAWVAAGVAGTTAVVATLAAVAVGPDRALLSAAAALAGLAAVAGLAVVIRWWNRLIALVEQVRAAWAHLEADLQRRHDTIGNLVAVVREAAARENAVQTGAADARADLGGAVHRGVPDADRVSSAGAAVGALGAVERQALSVAEHYPSLQASENFQHLQATLGSIENRIAAGRGFYNDAINLLDTRVDTFPGVLVRSWVLPTPRPALLQFDAADLGTAG
jgi:LemA protein